MRLNKDMRKIIAQALKEDAVQQDISTLSAISPLKKGKAQIIVKEKGILCGIEIARAVFKQVNQNVSFRNLRQDGSLIQRGQKVAILQGRVRDILAAERVALNFLSHLSGIASLTRQFVDKVRPKKVKIMDTRKTLPNLRMLQKYAVGIGGGYSHRQSLSCGILIKDNHLKSGQYLKRGKLDQQKITLLFAKLKKRNCGEIEVEVENLKQLRQIMQFKPDIIMLDNFSLADLKKAVRLRNQNFAGVKLEASGGINLRNVRQVASSGADRISIGSITHSPKAIDFSLDII